MRVLVVHASRHGATAGIAQRIGATLVSAGIEAEVHPVKDALIIARAGQLGRYDAFVIGSAIYAFRWLGEAKDFLRLYASELRAHPVWVFGSGPLGDKLIDGKGHDVTAVPDEMVGLARSIGARDAQIFFGAWDPRAEPVGLMERVMHAIPAARDALPAGDFRQWDVVDAWAQSLARELTAVPAAV